MGFFSSIFGGGKKNGFNKGFNFNNSSPSYMVFNGSDAKGAWIQANRFNKAKGGFAGGWGAIAFGNIVSAHSSADEIVEEFGLDKPDCPYCDCYEEAYEEEMENAIVESFIETILGAIFGDNDEPEVDMEEVQRKAYEDAISIAEDWISGSCWIPSEVLDWAYYEISDHN